MKIVSVVGARPQFIKAAPVSRALRRRHTEVLVHTGQHYDDNMSAVFFRELGLPEPDHHLGVGSGTHGVQTGQMLMKIEAVLLDEQPDWVLVYGDTNSTAAGALAAAKLHLPVAHVEAGLRSFNRAMPEEINRVVADHLSTLLLCPSETAARQLSAEGVTRGVHVVGDVMADSLQAAAGRAREMSDVLARFGLSDKRYLLATVHRAENTDDPTRLGSLLAAFGQAGEPIIFPVHPRTRKRLDEFGLKLPQNVSAVEPQGYLDTVRLIGAARLVLTDSGGMQKEAYWLGVPCVTLRGETEWVETVEAGWNTLVGTDPECLLAAVRGFAPPTSRPVLYGDGHAAERVAEIVTARARG